MSTSCLAAITALASQGTICAVSGAREACYCNNFNPIPVSTACANDPTALWQSIFQTAVSTVQNECKAAGLVVPTNIASLASATASTAASPTASADAIATSSAESSAGGSVTSQASPTSAGVATTASHTTSGSVRDFVAAGLVSVLIAFLM
ncbi:hypothetical protein HDU98_006937 [Podochytrium sp. JEL0797]|nr:hypothetical protein HDU98_006937 [Podochytrium sp. JEL0797]